MAQTVSVIVGAEDRARLAAVVGDRNRLQKHVQRASTTELKEAIARFIREHNKTPKPFVWTQSAEAILAKLHRLPVPSE